MSTTGLSSRTGESIPFYRDGRVLAVLAQIAFVAVVALFGTFLTNNMLAGLRASNIPLSWDFLGQEAGFEIAEGPTFEPVDNYGRAFVVGISNTVRVAVAGIILATLLGVVAGIARLSNNWLLRNLASAYIELIRNTPLLVQLFFWYFAVILKLPDIKEAIAIPGVAMLSNRGIGLTWLFLTESGRPWLYWLAAGLIVAILLGWLRRRRLEQQGLVGNLLLWAIPGFLLVAVAGYLVTMATVSVPENLSYELRRGDRGTLFVDVDGDGKFTREQDRPMKFVTVTLLAEDGRELASMATDKDGEFRFADLGEDETGSALTWVVPPPLVLSQPELQGFNYRGGQGLTPEFAALLIGLVVYTAAFIAEIVRAGINAVSKGQWEASRALGLTSSQSLRMIVLPQAMRVVIPPLTSQYLNLTKNSSLAIAVGYPDLFNVSRTIFNQSGAAVQMFALIMVTYLALSLLTSTFMNWYNSKMALVER